MTKLIEAVPTEIKNSALDIIDKSERKTWDTARWNEQIEYRGIHIKYDKQVESLVNFYPKKIYRVERELEKMKDLPVANDKDVAAIWEEVGVIVARRQEIEELTKEGNTLSMFEQQKLNDEYLDIGDEKKELKNSIQRKKWIPQLETKVERLKDKFTASYMELDIRDKKLLTREPIGTTYYIDLDAGDNGAVGTATGTAWLTIEQYTTTTARTAGDIGKIRAGTTETPAADVVFDESGNDDSMITLKGCDSVDDPWGDASDVRPVIDILSAPKQLNISGNDNWKFEHIEFRDGDDAYGMVKVSGGALEGSVTIFDDCKFVEYGEIDSDEGALHCLAGFIYIVDCEFDNNKYNHIAIDNDDACLFIKNCTFEGGQEGGSTDFVIRHAQGDLGKVFMEDCEIGQNSAHDSGGTAAIYTYLSGPRYFVRNCLFEDAAKAIRFGQSYYPYMAHQGIFLSQDHNQVKDAQWMEGCNIEVWSDTGVIRATSDASYSLKVLPSSVGFSDHWAEPLININSGYLNGAFKIYATAAATTVTIYVRGITFTTWPTAAEFYLAADYFDEGSGGSRARAVSNDVLTDNTTWVAFDVTFTPAQAGWVFLEFFFKMDAHDYGGGFYIDPLPVVS